MRDRSVLVVGLVLGLALGLVGAPLEATAQAQTGRYYVKLTGIDEAAGVSSGIVTELKQLVLDEIKRHPELLLELPDGLPAAPEALGQALKARHLHAYELTIKVLKVTEALRPPEPGTGKRFRVLERSIQLSLFGNTLTEKTIAVGGDGESQIGAEVREGVDLAREGRELLLECAKTAVAQAVNMTVAKFKLSEKSSRIHRPKKRA